MQLDTGLVADPKRNGIFATLAMAVSMFVFAYSSRFGKPPILAFYAVWLPMLALPYHHLWSRLHRPAVLLALPLLALASVLWSDRPDVTLRAAVQYGSTVLLGLVAARCIGMAAFVRGVMLGGLVVLLYSHSVGGYAYDVVDGSYAFSGAFSSKNQLGLFASLTLIGALGVMMLDRFALAWAGPAMVVSGFALWTVILTESATAMITVALALMVMAAGAMLMRFDSRFRRGAVVLLVIILGAGLAAAFQGGALDAVLGVFGKDSTLTGRTYLWSRGVEVGQNAAPLGLGYNAFWVQGRGLAEELWLEFYIDTFTGFHFHNTLIEGYVGLGGAGVTLLASWTLGLPVMAVWYLLADTGSPYGGSEAAIRDRHRAARGAGAVFAAMAVLFAIRAFVEIDFFSPYTAGSFIVPFLLLSMADRVGDAARDRPLPAEFAATQHPWEHFARDPAFPATDDDIGIGAPP